jgi:hypothetical protein
MPIFGMTSFGNSLGAAVAVEVAESEADGVDKNVLDGEPVDASDGDMGAAICSRAVVSPRDLSTARRIRLAASDFFGSVGTALFASLFSVKSVLGKSPPFGKPRNRYRSMPVECRAT